MTESQEGLELAAFMGDILFDFFKGRRFEDFIFVSLKKKQKTRLSGLQHGPSYSQGFLPP